MAGRVDVRFSSDVDLFANRMEVGARVTLPSALEANAEMVRDITIEETRKYIPAEHRKAPGQTPKSLSTGRLYSSFGRAVIQSNNPDFDLNEAVNNIRSVKPKAAGRDMRIHIEVGTTVPYARNANYGIPSIPHGYTFTKPYFFAEKGAADAEVKVKQLMIEQTERHTRNLVERRRSRRLKSDPRATRLLLKDPGEAGEVVRFVEY